jgi:hypothetical protein
MQSNDSQHLNKIKFHGISTGHADTKTTVEHNLSTTGSKQEFSTVGGSATTS